MSASLTSALHEPAVECRIPQAGRSLSALFLVQQTAGTVGPYAQPNGTDHPSFILDSGSMKLHRFWIRFGITLSDPHPVGVLPGCGVTAVNFDDAMAFLRDQVFSNHAMPEPVSILEDVNVAELPAMVRFNIGDVTVRGIWFPQGYEVPSR